MSGLVPDVARDLTVTIPQAGLLVTGYALAVTVGAPTVTALTGRLPRRGLVVGLMGLFTLGNLLGGAAPAYEVLLAGRIVTRVAHGVFIAVGAPIAMSLADRERGARAVATMFAGLTLETVISVPSGRALDGVRRCWGWLCRGLAPRSRSVFAKSLAQHIGDQKYG
jgi:MFS transporter, DHA1 family, inner membrane transport protein